MKKEEKVTHLRFYLLPFVLLFFMVGMVLPSAVHSKKVKSLSANVGPGGNVWLAARTLADFLQMEESAFVQAWDGSHTIIRGVKVPLREVNLVDPGTKVFWDNEQHLFEVEVIGLGTIYDFQILLEQALFEQALLEKKHAAIVSEKMKASSPVPKVIKKAPIDPLFDPDIEVRGLVLNQMQTRLGHTFYRYFVTYWEEWKGSEGDPFTILITERTSARKGNRVSVYVNNSIAYQTIVRARSKDIEMVAKEGVSATRTFIDKRRQGL